MKSAETVDSGKKDVEIGGSTYRLRYYVKNCNPQRYSLEVYLFEVKKWLWIENSALVESKYKFIEKDTPHLDRDNFTYNYTLRDKSLEEWVKVMWESLIAVAKAREDSRKVNIDL